MSHGSVTSYHNLAKNHFCSLVKQPEKKNKQEPRVQGEAWPPWNNLFVTEEDIS